jgi:hypothetical protein
LRVRLRLQYFYIATCKTAVKTCSSGRLLVARPLHHIGTFSLLFAVVSLCPWGVFLFWSRRLACSVACWVELGPSMSLCQRGVCLSQSSLSRAYRRLIAFCSRLLLKRRDRNTLMSAEAQQPGYEGSALGARFWFRRCVLVYLSGSAYNLFLDVAREYDRQIGVVVVGICNILSVVLLVWWPGWAAVRE